MGRGGAMELWQMDVVGGVLLADGSECKVLTGIDDHSRFVVCAGVMVRATSRAVCSHLAEAHGAVVPDVERADIFNSGHIADKPFHLAGAASEAGTLLLAIRVDGEPISEGHGAPLRLVAPGRRGFWWVKWVTSIEASDVPWWWQPPFPLS